MSYPSYWAVVYTLDSGMALWGTNVSPESPQVGFAERYHGVLAEACPNIKSPKPAQYIWMVIFADYIEPLPSR